MPLQYKEAKKIAKDAKRVFSFSVNNRDCKNGSPKSPSACAVTLAARRADPAIEAVHTYRTIAYVEYKNGKVLRYENSRNAEAMVNLYDSLKGHMTMSAPLVVSFKPPRPALSLRHLRSTARKRITKASRERTKNKKQRRVYRVGVRETILAGVRHGGYQFEKKK